jgi:hypothetical protein
MFVTPVAVEGEANTPGLLAGRTAQCVGAAPAANTFANWRVLNNYKNRNSNTHKKGPTSRRAAREIGSRRASTPDLEENGAPCEERGRSTHIPHQFAHLPKLNANSSAPFRHMARQ